MKKSKWLFNIMTTVLCICAMAIGVYAAKQASLTVNGQIAFNAHNCKVQVSGTVNAYNEEGSAKLTGNSATLPTTIVDGKAEKVNFPTKIYFSDMEEGGDTISLNLVITNLSAFAIDAVINSPVFKLDTTVSTLVTSTVSSSSFTLEPDAYTPVTITFTLADIQNASSITNGNYELFMEFEKSGPGVETSIAINNLVDTSTSERTSKEVTGKTNCNEELTTSTISLGDMTPYKEDDVVSDISLTATLTNNTEVKAYVEISSPTGLPDGVALSTTQQYVTLPFKTYISAGESKTLTFGLTTTGTDQIAVNSSSITVSVQEDTENHSTLFQYESNVGWYATMGTNPYSGYNEPLRWLPIAQNTTEIIEETPVSEFTSADYGKYDYTTNCPTVGSSYYLLSQYILDVTASQCEISYGYYSTTTSSYSINEAVYYNGSEWVEVDNVLACDYSVSNVRAYLNGLRDSYYGYTETTLNSTAAYIGDTSKTLTSFTKQFSISNGDLYNSIVKRTQTSLYKEMKYSQTYTSETDYSVSWNSDNTLIKETEEDSFWILSGYEMYNFIDNSVAVWSSSSVKKAYKLSDMETAGNWWSRTPSGANDYNEFYFSANGSFATQHRLCFWYAGVRPAIQVACTI